MSKQRLKCEYIWGPNVPRAHKHTSLARARKKIGKMKFKFLRKVYYWDLWQSAQDAETRTELNDCIYGTF